MEKKLDQNELVGEEAILSLTEFSLICETEEPYIIEMVEMGILEPEGEAAGSWHFSLLQLHRFRRARRLHTDLKLNLAGVALSLDLLDELRQLRQYIQKLENQVNLLTHS